MTDDNIKSNQGYEELLKGFDNIGTGLDELIKSFSHELESVKKLSNREENFHEEIEKDVKNVQSLFQDDRIFNVFKKLCELELLKTVKETFELKRSDIQLIDKVIKQGRSNISAQGINQLQKVTEGFTEKDIEYFEKVIATYEEEGINREFDSFAQKRFTEHKKDEAKTKQAYDQWEKEQLNKGKTGLTRSIKSLFTKVLKAVVEKFRFKKDLIDFENLKEGKSSFVSHLPENLDDLTDFDTQVKGSNSSKMDTKKDLIDLSSNLSQVAADEVVSNKKLKK